MRLWLGQTIANTWRLWGITWDNHNKFFGYSKALSHCSNCSSNTSCNTEEKDKENLSILKEW